MIWMMNAQGWGWTPWLCWSRAFTIPYFKFNWRAGTNSSILVGNAWVYGRNRSMFAEGPWFTSCSYTKPPADCISIHAAIQVSSVNSTSPLKSYPISYPISYNIVYYIVSDMFQYLVRYRVQCILYSTQYLMHCFCQQGLMPALDSDMAEVITGSEFVVEAYTVHW